MDKLNISRSGDKLTREDVIEKIKEYLKRLKNKDNLESVRADFVKEFPENEHQHVHQFNLSKIDPTRLLHIW